MSDLTPAASWDAVVQLSGTMAGVPATWNVPNQALLNRTEWLKTFGVFKDDVGNVAIPSVLSVYGSAAFYGGQVNMGKSTGAAADQILYRDQTNFYTFDIFRNAGVQYAGFITGQTFGMNWNVNTGLKYTWQVNAAGIAEMDASGLLWKASTGGIGYGLGAGGTVTQATNKSTGVTLSKPSGTITMSGAALASGAAVSFTLTNTLITPLDILDVAVQWGAFTPENYRVRAACGNGAARITLENVSGGSLSEALPINFALKRVANT